MKTEKELEQYLVKRAKALGGECYKWTSPNVTGVPDRILLGPKGSLAFVEVKSPKRTGRLRKNQAVVIRRLKSLGFRVFVIDSEEGANGCLSSVFGEALYKGPDNLGKSKSEEA